jgi:translation initiation factor eIF-2B subunit delta
MSSADPPVIVEPPKAEPATPKAQTPGESSSAAAGQPKNEAAPAGAPKLSNAELKKQAKAEKAARRAQAAQEKQSGAPNSSPSGPPGPGQGQKTEGLKVAKGPQHRRSGSSSGGSQNLPIRGSAQKAPPVPALPKEEDKTVEFFRHLYKPRTTTVAGASKEIHPAVLALGLQISSYTLCGSCARLVATLQAFKKVSLQRHINSNLGSLRMSANL